MARVRKNISVDHDLWSKFEDRCGRLGYKMSNMIELLIFDYLEDGKNEKKTS